MLTRILIAAIGLCALTVSAVHAQNKPCPTVAAKDTTLAKRVKVYRSENGLRIAVVRLVDSTPPQALIEVTGLDENELDGLVLLHQVKTRSKGRLGFSTQVAGRGHQTLRTERTRWGDREYFVFRRPNSRQDDIVYYDDKASVKVKPSELLSKHRKQVEAGTCEEYQRFDREAEIAKQNAKLAKRGSRMEKATSRKIPARILWDTVSNQQIKTLSISSHCAAPLDALRRLCEGRQAEYFKAQVSDRVKRVECRFGNRQHLELKSDGTLVWTTVKGALNQGDFAYFSLMNALS